MLSTVVKFIIIFILASYLGQKYFYTNFICSYFVCFVTLATNNNTVLYTNILVRVNVF